MLNEGSQAQGPSYMIPFTYNSRADKINLLQWNENSGCLKWRKLIEKGRRGTFQRDEIIPYLREGVGFMWVYHLSSFIKLST